MFNRKSIYALNKKDPNAIVYTDADGNLIRLTCDDFACAAEFRRWKDWSDSDLRKEENADHKQSDNSISLEVLSEEATAVVSIEDEYDDTTYPPLEGVPLKFAISKRNEWMVDQADVVVAYVQHSWGGAAATLRYAESKHKRIIRI